jgi:hypothetical protein
MPSDEITGSPEESSPPWTDEKKDAGISMRVEAREAASRALHHWQNGMDFCPSTDLLWTLKTGQQRCLPSWMSTVLLCLVGFGSLA